MSGQDFSDPHGPMAVETIAITPAQVRLDHAVDWIAEHGCADCVANIDCRTSVVTINLRKVADVHRVLRGSNLIATESTSSVSTHIHVETDCLRIAACELVGSEPLAHPRKVTL